MSPTNALRDDLRGLPALITGAASGMCRASSLRLAAEGALVVLLDRDTEGLEKTKREIIDAGGRAAAFTVDVSDMASVASAISQAADAFGAPKILVNGAGIVIRKALLETEPEDWERVLSVNLTGCYHLLREVIRRMAAGGGGSIIQIASSAAHLGGHGYTSYTASKAGVVAMTRQLAAELGKDNIRINSVSPGAIDTAINNEAFADDAVREAMTAAIPMNRIGTPSDIAGVIAFLAGPDSNYITGTDIRVDGGLTSHVNIGGTGGDRYANFDAANH